MPFGGFFFASGAFFSASHLILPFPLDANSLRLHPMTSAPNELENRDDDLNRCLRKVVDRLVENIRYLAYSRSHEDLFALLRLIDRAQKRALAPPSPQRAVVEAKLEKVRTAVGSVPLPVEIRRA